MIHARRYPSPALVVASIALAISLGGTGYAALRLPANSVGTPQLKQNAVTSIKVRNGALRLLDFAPVERPKLKGDKGEPGAAGAKGDRGDKGDKGDKGDPGPAGVTGLQRVFGPGTSIPAGGTTSLFASCPSGKRVLGGGASAGNSTQGIVYSSVPNTDTSWAAGVRNPTAGAITYQAWAVCATVG